MQGQVRFCVITIFLAAFYFHSSSGEALKCYQCVSKLSKTCANAPSSKEVTTCPPFAVSCMTYIMEIQQEDILVRGCGVRDNCNYIKNMTKSCNECYTDLCNSSAANV